MLKSKAVDFVLWMPKPQAKVVGPVGITVLALAVLGVLGIVLHAYQVGSLPNWVRPVSIASTAVGVFAAAVLGVYLKTDQVKQRKLEEFLGSPAMPNPFADACEKKSFDEILHLSCKVLDEKNSSRVYGIVMQKLTEGGVEKGEYPEGSLGALRKMSTEEVKEAISSEESFLWGLLTPKQIIAFMGEAEGKREMIDKLFILKDLGMPSVFGQYAQHVLKKLDQEDPTFCATYMDVLPGGFAECIVELKIPQGKGFPWKEVANSPKKMKKLFSLEGEPSDTELLLLKKLEVETLKLLFSKGLTKAHWDGLKEKQKKVIPFET